MSKRELSLTLSLMSSDVICLFSTVSFNLSISCEAASKLPSIRLESSAIASAVASSPASFILLAIHFGSSFSLTGQIWTKGERVSISLNHYVFNTLASNLGKVTITEVFSSVFLKSPWSAFAPLSPGVLEETLISINFLSANSDRLLFSKRILSQSKEPSIMKSSRPENPSLLSISLSKATKILYLVSESWVI